MNGIPVYPRPKNGERPYLATPKPVFRNPFLALFWGCRRYVGGGRWVCILCRIPINTTNRPHSQFNSDTQQR